MGIIQYGLVDNGDSTGDSSHLRREAGELVIRIRVKGMWITKWSVAITTVCNPPSFDYKPTATLPGRVFVADSGY